MRVSLLDGWFPWTVRIASMTLVILAIGWRNRRWRARVFWEFVNRAITQARMPVRDTDRVRQQLVRDDTGSARPGPDWPV
jgi:hypothetical protein